MARTKAIKRKPAVSRSRTAREAVCSVPRVKVWIELRGKYVFGPGLARILDAIEECGSIKDAAARLGRSYRYVWGRIKEAERALGRPLVETRVGGQESQRSTLTPVARRLVTGFQQLRLDAVEAVEREFVRRFTDLL